MDKTQLEETSTLLVVHHSCFLSLGSAKIHRSGSRPLSTVVVYSLCVMVDKARRRIDQWA